MICERAAKLSACERKAARVNTHLLQNHLVVEEATDLYRDSQAVCDVSGGRGEG